MKDPIDFLRSLYQAGLAAADPLVIAPRHLPAPPPGRTVVIGAGKAAAAMAKAVEDAWPADKPLSGLVVTQYGHGLPTRRIEVSEAAHPFPDEAAEDAARRMLRTVKGLGPEDMVLALMSGGGSSLLSLPASGVSRAEKNAVIGGLMKAGAPIGAINCVRKHLSAIKGGRLALAAHPAPVITLIISDVPGDAPHLVASGPTLPDPTTLDEAREILAQYNIDAPESVRAALADVANETPKPGDARFAGHSAKIIAQGQDALTAAARVAAAAGIEPVILGDAIEGEARKVGAEHAMLALRSLKKAPCVLLSGGETTVTVTGEGRGGRNSEYLLGALLAARGQRQIYGLAAGTDGRDGSGGNAGAFFTPATLAQAAAKGLSAEAALAANDSFTFFEALGGLVVTGPTRTNVNDFRAILVV